MHCAKSTEWMDRIHAHKEKWAGKQLPDMRTSMLQLEHKGVKPLKLKRAFIILSGTWKMFHITAVQVLKVRVAGCEDGSK